MLQKKKRSLTLLIVLTVLVIIFILVLINSLRHITAMSNEAKEFLGDFKPVLAACVDGTYNGQYTLSDGKTGAEITFTIKDHMVSAVSLLSIYHTPWYPIAKTIKPTIETKKDLGLDAVSGATISFLFVKAAIKDALAKGPAHTSGNLEKE